MMKNAFAAVCAVSLLTAGAASANSLVAPGAHSGVASSSIATTSTGEWNKLSRTDGPGVEVWTRDGDSLNKVSFFGGIGGGLPIYRERNKKEAPLPKVTENMLLPDIPVLLESTYRSQYQVNKFSLQSQDIVTIEGKQAIRFTYSFVRSDDEVERKGEAIGSIVKGKLFMVTYEAPAIYFFDKDLQDFRKMAETLKF